MQAFIDAINRDRADCHEIFLTHQKRFEERQFLVLCELGDFVGANDMHQQGLININNPEFIKCVIQRLDPYDQLTHGKMQIWQLIQSRDIEWCDKSY